MKRAFLNTILATIGINIMFPILCYLLFGIIYVFMPFDVEYLVYSSLILIGVLLASYYLIWRSKKGIYKYNIEELLNSRFLNKSITEYLFIASVLLNAIKQIVLGGFAGILAGAGNGGLISYVQLFLNIHVLHFLVLLRAYRDKKVIKIIIWETLYLATTLLSASRSGIFWIVFFNISIIASLQISKKIKRRIISLVCVAVLVSPVLFAFSTNTRDKVKHSTDTIARTIVARLSYLELASIEMDQYLNNSYEKDIFQEKYGIKNQFEQSVNSIIPGSVFADDVQPNQYWRSVFSGWTLTGAKMNYTSINMVLPIYFIFKFGITAGVIICILFIFFLYRIIARIKDPAISTFLSCFLFYTLFQYFDWVYHFQDIVGIVLTLFFVKVVSGEFLFGKIRFVAIPNDVNDNSLSKE